MDITAAEYNRIARFLDAEMTLEEMEAFETELCFNPKMRMHLDFEQSVRDCFAPGINVEIEKKTRENEVKEVRQDLLISIKRLLGRKWFIATAAACVLGIFITNIVINLENPQKPDLARATASKGNNDTSVNEIILAPKSEEINNNNTTLFDTYFKMDNLPDDYPMFLADAFDRYQKGDFDRIEKINLAELPVLRGVDPNLEKQQILELGHYYKGIALLNASKVDNALLNLRWVEKNSKDDTLKVKAKWYMALAYLQKNKMDDAKKVLLKVVNNKINKLLVKNAKKVLEEL